MDVNVNIVSAFCPSDVAWVWFIEVLIWKWMLNKNLLTDWSVWKQVMSNGSEKRLTRMSESAWRGPGTCLCILFSVTARSYSYCPWNDPGILLPWQRLQLLYVDQLSTELGLRKGHRRVISPLNRLIRCSRVTAVRNSRSFVPCACGKRSLEQSSSSSKFKVLGLQSFVGFFLFSLILGEHFRMMCHIINTYSILQKSVLCPQKLISFFI